MNRKSDVRSRRSPPGHAFRSLLCLAFATLFLASCSRVVTELEGRDNFARNSKPIILIQGWERLPGLLDEESALSAFATIRTKAPIQSPFWGAQDRSTSPVTYRIRLPSDLAPAHFSLYLPGAGKFASISVNGRAIYTQGQDEDPGDELHFTAAGPEVSIVVRSQAGGPRLENPGLVPRVILFGNESSIRTFRLFASGIALLQIGYFILAGVFVFVLFLFWRKNGDFLALSCYMLAAGVFTLAKAGGLFGLLSLPRAVSSFFAIVSASILVSSLAFFLHSCFKGRFNRIIPLLASRLPLVFVVAAGMVFLFPAAEGILYLLTSAWFLVFFGAVIIWLVLDIKREDSRTRWLLPAIIISAISIGAQRFFPTSLIAAIYVEPAGLTVFAFVAMLMLVRKVGDTFETSETLTDYVTNITTTMKRFIPIEFLECLNKENVVDLKLGDHVRKEMTIFFSDIRSFTELSEKLTVEENFAFINSYLARVVPIIAENGGFVDKYIGDGIMALFEGDKGPDAAIRAAIAMQVKMVEYNGHRAKMGYRAIGMGVGVHTGDLMLGVIGVDNRMENTVISDSVNLASRLQSITKAFNISLAISEQAFKELEDPGAYKYRFIGKVKVKGKAAPVSVFEIYDGIAPDLFERKMKANTYFEQGMLSYYQKDFGGAMYYFKRVLEIIPEDGAASFYLENCINKASI